MSSSFSAFFSLSKNCNNDIPFNDYYKKWFNTLRTSLLPLLRQSLSSPTTSPALLTSRLHLLLHHFLSYYDSLDLAATANSTTNLPHLLYPSWKNSLERPFLFLGDLHPYVFTNLVRSFIDKENNNDLDGFVFDDRSWQVALAWKDPSTSLITKIEQIERGLRLMVPDLMGRVKKAEAGFVARVGENWVSCLGKKERLEVGEAVKVEMEELVSVFVDANRLRRNVISEIVGALNLYQGALFLEGVAQFLVGFKDSDLLRQFEKCKIPINERFSGGFKC